MELTSALVVKGQLNNYTLRSWVHGADTSVQKAYISVVYDGSIMTILFK